MASLDSGNCLQRREHLLKYEIVWVLNHDGPLPQVYGSNGGIFTSYFVTNWYFHGADGAKLPFVGTGLPTASQGAQDNSNTQSRLHTERQSWGGIEEWNPGFCQHIFPP